MLIVVAAFDAGILNAVASGGSFLTFPVLVFVGFPSIFANATSAVAGVDLFSMTGVAIWIAGLAWGLAIEGPPVRFTTGGLRPSQVLQPKT